MVVDLCQLLYIIIIITRHSRPSFLILLSSFFQHPSVYLTKLSAAIWCAMMYSMLKLFSCTSVGVSLAVSLQYTSTVEYAPKPWIDFDYTRIWHGTAHIYLPFNCHQNLWSYNYF
jgi:hypothetical protein